MNLCMNMNTSEGREKGKQVNAESIGGIFFRYLDNKVCGGVVVRKIY